MGVLDNDFRRTHRRVGSLLTRAILTGSALLLGASIAASDATEPGDATPVSTSPSAIDASDSKTPRSTPAPDTQAPTLTRAAARSKLEAISPLPWLARFGRVEIVRRD
jgi:hypothetical protein